MLDFTNDYDFNILELPLIPQGMQKPVEGWKLLVREDTGEHLHVHRDSYQVLPHADVVQATEDALKAADISSDYDFNVYCHDKGRKLEIDVKFNNLVIDPAVGDHVKFRVRGLNSYDGQWALQTVTDALRLWCDNGCVTADSVSSIWQRHTNSISVEGIENKIKLGVETFFNQKEQWQEWMKTKVERDDVEKLFRSQLVKRASKTSEEKHNKKQLENLMGQLDTEFSGLGENKWAVYNCMTHWATHTNDNKKPHMVTRKREKAVGQVLNTKQWLEI